MLLFDPYKGTVRTHLLKHDFMEDYTLPPNHGDQDLSDDNWTTDEEGAGYVDVKESEEGGNEEAEGHIDVGGHEEEVDTQQCPSLASKLDDPHLQDLLHKKMTNE
jgi:hypothetical protein